MRITHQMLSRNYLNRMNSNLSTLTHSNEKMSSQRAFNKGYENVSDAGKALRLRKLVAENERYQVAVRDAQGRAAAAEESLRTVNSILTIAKDRTVYGLNGTLSDLERENLATELGKFQDEIFQIMNTTFNEKHVFAAAGNKDGSPPFTKGGANELLFNGTAVDGMEYNPFTGKPATSNGGVLTDVPYNADNYIDIGFGYKLMSNGRVDPNTAFKDTYSGVESFGYGTSSNGAPLNAYSLLGDMMTNLRSNNMADLGKDLDALSDTSEYLLKTITEIGARGVTLENTASSLESEYIRLLETQQKVEGIDLSEEIIHNKQFEMSWMVTLQLGSKILPQTIFDFIR